MNKSTAVLLGLFVALGVAIGVAWGARALIVCAVFAVVAVGIVAAASAGGDWVRDVSAGRFDRRR